MSERIAIITLMRKGSKRLPGKNKLPFRGKPLYRHTVDFAVELSKDLKCEYYLLHDYDDIPEIPGVNQITGLPDFGGDIHNTSQNIIDSGINADIYILLQVTSPLRIKQDVKFAFKRFINNDFKSMYSAHQLPQGLYSIAGVKNYNPLCRNYFSFKTQIVYKETGSYYIFKASELGYQHFMAREFMSTLTKDYYNIDINTQEDYEELLKKYEN